MDSKSVEELLAKYYEGETSIEEEKKLKKFFNSGDVPGELAQEQIKFRFYADAFTERTDKSFEDKLITGETHSPKINRAISFRPGIRTVSAIAAGLILLFGVSLFLKRDVNFNKKNNYGTYNNPQIAYAQTKNALLLISNKLNKGNRNLSKLSKLYEIQTLITTKNNKK